MLSADSVDVVILSPLGQLAKAIASRMYSLDAHLFHSAPQDLLNVAEHGGTATTTLSHARTMRYGTLESNQPVGLLRANGSHCLVFTLHTSHEGPSSLQEALSPSSTLDTMYAGRFGSLTVYVGGGDGDTSLTEDALVSLLPTLPRITTNKTSSTVKSAGWQPVVTTGMGFRNDEVLETNLVAYIRRSMFEMTSAWASPSVLYGSPCAPIPLAMAPCYVTAGNVRRHPSSVESVVGQRSTEELVIDATAVGREGDLVFGRVCPLGTLPHYCERSTLDASLPRSLGPAARVMDAQHEDLFFRQPFYALVPLGNRESSTHVNGGIPLEGVLRGRDVVHWIAGESGLVGVLMAEGAVANALAETSVSFQLLGVLRRVKSAELVTFERVVSSGSETDVSSPPAGGDASPMSPPSLRGTNVNLLHLARTPIATNLSIPIVCIAGTSAEAGKTTLASKVISILTHVQKRRVGCIKATGTGGLPDCDAYRNMGAEIVLDQVDAGLPTTYTDPSRVQEFLPRSFLLCEDAGVDVVVVELGGDIIWANNTTLLSMPIFRDALHRLFLLCNDTMAAIGAREFLSGRVHLHPYEPNQGVAAASRCVGETADRDDLLMRTTGPLLPPDRVVYVASPFRSHLGATLRAAAVQGMPLPLDPNDMDAIAEHLADILPKTC
jgi:hypothetical protein